MNRPLLLAIAALVYVVFGLGLLIAPTPFMQPYGISFDPAGTMIARVAGASLVAFAVGLWFSRKAEGAALRPWLIGGLVYNLVELPLTLLSIRDGVLNALGWFPFALHIGLAAIFLLAMRARA